MVLPPVVGGIALLAAFGRRGLLGGPLWDWFGISLPFTQTALVMAQSFVALPFFVVAAESAFRQLDRSHEEMAATLGAGASRTLATIVVPATWPALSAGLLLAWARALGEFGATITFAGSFPGRTQTLPMLVYSELETDWGRSLVLGAVMIVVAAGLLGALRARWAGSGIR
jgi:molybdate transport system permease protein